jgi:cobalamin transport system substrate-binding protein
MLRRWLLVWFCVAAIVGAPGCRDEGPSPEPARPTLATTVPSVVEIVFAMGQGDHLVGRGRYCVWPLEARALPVIGDAIDLNFEKLVALRPELMVFNTSDTRRLDRLTRMSIRCLAPKMETVADVVTVIELLGHELEAPAAARQLTDRLRGELDEVREAARNLIRPKVLVTFPAILGGAGDVQVVGRETFVDELVTLAGGRNVARLSGYPRVSAETVARWAPEVIIISAPGDIAPGQTDESYRKAWSRWQSIPAVRDGRIEVLREPYLTLPGPRMGAAARLLLGVLHGDALDTTK